MQIVRTDATHPGLAVLVRELDAELAGHDGDDAPFFQQFNKLDSVPYAVVVLEGEQAIACGALRPYSEGVIEVKRMYVRPEHRGRGLSRNVLQELEKWAAELGFHELILETNKTFAPAVGLYRASGYEPIPNYGHYDGVESSVCMKKTLA
ncbi:MAG: GNAT family N-acetyltransferase [Armatimonadetes bacterium]|nr:GNAT family N-acetyltransferase [Armatimonadota bacterium]